MPAILTLGLLLLFVPFIVNAVLLWLTDKVLSTFKIDSLSNLLDVGRSHNGCERAHALRAADDGHGPRRGTGPDALDLTQKACNLCRMRTLPARLSLDRFPLSGQSFPVSGARLAAALLVARVAAPACKKASVKPAQDKGDLSQVVAQVGDETITVGDLQERLNKQSPFIRARYTTLDKKKEFLDNLVRFEVMAGEAQKRGYDKDPEVQRVMKQQMISKFLQKDFESTLKVEDVPDADVEKYYKDHPEEFNKKDEVRVSEILVKDKPKADKAYAEAKAQPKTAGADQKGFRDLVTKYSEDDESKARGGDLTFFDKDSTAYPKPIIEAAFKLGDVGDVSPPIKTDKGWVVLKLTQKRPGFSRPARRGQAPDPAAAVPRHAHQEARRVHRRPQEEHEDRDPRGQPRQGRHRERHGGRRAARPAG